MFKSNQSIIASRAAGQKAGWELVPTDSAPVTNSELKPVKVVSGRSVGVVTVSCVFCKV